MHIHAKAQGAVVDTCQLVAHDQTPACGIHQFLGTDGEEFPFADGLDALYLGRFDADLLIGAEVDMIVLRQVLQPEESHDEQRDGDHDQANLNICQGLHHSSFLISCRISSMSYCLRKATVMFFSS